MFDRFHQITGRVPHTVRHFEKESGRPVIGVMPAYFPLELIWAAGGYPVQLWGNNLPIEKADAQMQSYCCSVARSVLELELRGSADMVKAYAFTSLCDTLINTREIYRRLFSKPTIELSIPITRTEKARRQYLTTVVDGIMKQLGEITGHPPTGTSLQQAAELYGRSRELLRELYAIRRQKPGLVKSSDFYTVVKTGFFLPPGEYNRMLDTLLEQLRPLVPPQGARPKLLLSGMVFDPLSVHRIFDDAGADVVDDDFANGWRAAAKATLQVDDLVTGIADYLFGAAPCCCLYNPENSRHSYLVEKARSSGADGLVFWYIKFCEPDAFDRPQLAARLKKEGIPTTTVELELSMGNFDAVQTRITAFCEILEA